MDIFEALLILGLSERQKYTRRDGKNEEQLALTDVRLLWVDTISRQCLFCKETWR